MGGVCGTQLVDSIFIRVYLLGFSHTQQLLLMFCDWFLLLILSHHQALTKNMEFLYRSSLLRPDDGSILAAKSSHQNIKSSCCVRD
jgi:hypothetical protein